MTQKFPLALPGQPYQVAIVTPSLVDSLREHLDLGPWHVYVYDRSVIPNLEMYGKPSEARFLIAFNRATPQLEFIQPLDEHSIYAEWLVRSEGFPRLHHLGFYCDNISAAVEASAEAVVNSGSGFGADDSGRFAYIDAVDRLGYYLELVEAPTVRRAPLLIETADDLARIDAVASSTL